MARVLGLLLLLGAAVAQPLDVASGAGKGAGPRLGPIRQIEITVTNRAGLDRLAEAGYDVANVSGGRVVLFADEEELADLHDRGWEWKVVEPRPAAQEGLSAKGLGAYNNYADLTALLDAYATNYPSICRKTSLGRSVQNRELWALKITRDPDLELDKPEFKYVGAIHGNEALGTELCLYFIDLLLQGYAGGDPRIVRLVDEVEIWIVPLMNPDGRESKPPQRFNANGYDLNRSFPEGSGQNLGNTLYGPPPNLVGLQPEVRQVMAWIDTHSFSLGANFHTGATVVNYPYDNDGRGSTFSPTPDEPLLLAMSLTYASNNLPMWNSAQFVHGVVNGAAWYSMSGGMQDWNYRYAGCVDFTIELSDDQWPDPPASQLSTYWDQNRESMLAYLEWSLKGLRGLLRDAQTGQPVRGAVRVEGRHHLVFSDPDVGDYHRLLLPGTYTVWSYAPGYVPQRIPNVVVGSDSATRLDVAMQPVNPRFTAQINFQPASGVPPTGSRADSGAAFGPRADGYTYGWETALPATSLIRRNAGRSQDPRYDTLCLTQAGGDHAWEIALPNGPYSVLVAAGDPNSTSAAYRILAEDTLALDGAPSADHRWVESLNTVVVTDGRLTLRNGAGAVNNALAFVELSALEPATIEQWRAVHFATTANSGSAANEADPDQDGCVNLLEYAVGQDPTQADTAPVLTPWVARAEGVARFGCEFLRNTNATDLTLAVEAADTSPASAWTPVTTYTHGGGWLGAGGAVTETPTDRGRVKVRVLEAHPVPASAGRFLRLRVVHSGR